ncbi:MAG: pyridoxamine 5'-phosphate oxidase family protein [Acidimicrobiia bacterium]|nr:pyridoxamine 5'-phosphate oxidase family protein [Acidimicrobiia bacterium]
MEQQQSPERSRTEVRRLPERGVYDRGSIDAILDEALICHVGFTTDDGPVVIPTIHARCGDVLYLHGSPASRMLRTTPGTQVCVTVTLVDGIVAARSTFHHSMNYRSVVVFGEPRVVIDPHERRSAFEAITEHVLPGRWEEARHPNEREDRGTRLLALGISEASAKMRTGPPGDEPEDMDLDVWAGVIPIRSVAGTPIPAPDLTPGVELPEYIRRYVADRTHI